MIDIISLKLRYSQLIYLSIYYIINYQIENLLKKEIYLLLIFQFINFFHIMKIL